VKSQILLFPSLLEQTRNRTSMPTQRYKEMVSSVLFCWVFHYFDFQRFGDLKISVLNVLSVLYFFIECFIIFIFSILGNWNHLSVLVNILSISDDWNFKFFFFPSWLEHTRNRTNLPIQSYKEMVSSVLFCWLYHYVDFHCLADLKTRILDIYIFA